MELIHTFSAPVLYERPKITVLRQYFKNVNEFFAGEASAEKRQLVDTPGILRASRTMEFGIFRTDALMTPERVLRSFARSAFRASLYEEALCGARELSRERLVWPILVLGSICTVDRMRYVPCLWNVDGRSLGLMRLGRSCQTNDHFLGVRRTS